MGHNIIILGSAVKLYETHQISKTSMSLVSSSSWFCSINWRQAMLQLNLHLSDQELYYLLGFVLYFTCPIRNGMAIVVKRPVKLVIPHRYILKKVGYISTDIINKTTTPPQTTRRQLCITESPPYMWKSKSRGRCKYDVTPLLTYLSYGFLALTHRNDHHTNAYTGAHRRLIIQWLLRAIFCNAFVMSLFTVVYTITVTS